MENRVFLGRKVREKLSSNLFCTWENSARFWLWWKYDETYVDIVHSSSRMI
jgi:hypothetical protein